MLHSVRARLTLWYTLILALVLVTFSMISYAFLARAIRAATDASLSNTAREFTAAFATDASPSDLRLDFRYSDRELLVLNKHGDIVASSRTRMPSAARRDIATAARDGMHGFHTYGDFRVLAVPLVVLGQPYTAVVAASLHAQRESLRAATRGVMLGIPMALVVAAAGGYLLARKALEPVTRMSMRAREIGAGTLDQRIPLVNERDELGYLALTLNELLERLQHAFDSQKRFMADASHELRTPVSIIQGEGDVALARPDRDAAEYRASIEVMRRAALNLTRIVQNLFLLARSDARAYPMTRSRFYVDEALVESARAMRSAAFAKRIALTCDCPAGLPMFADEELVRRLFLNLIENAVKFTPEDGAIRVGLKGHGDRYSIEVSDTGPGIAPSDQPHIFERFFRADRTRRRAAGAGLGLAIAKWIAETHGGSLSLERSDESGTTFAVELPVGFTTNDESPGNAQDAIGRAS